ISSARSRLFLQQGLSPPPGPILREEGSYAGSPPLQGGGQGVVAVKNYAGQHTGFVGSAPHQCAVNTSRCPRVLLTVSPKRRTNMKRPGTSSKIPILLIATVIGSAVIALAGTPLICQAIAIGDAKSLPWTSNTAFLNGKEGYDIAHLADDTLALLAPTMPVIVRMETLRRATVYAQGNSAVGMELFLKLRGRALGTGGQGKPDALALFDLGYFVECAKQANMTFRRNSSGGYDRVDQPSVGSGMNGL